MKILMIWWWDPKNSKEVTDRFIKWESKGKYQELYPTSTMIGMNKGFMIYEVDDLAEVQKDLANWSDICTFKLIPIMDSRDAVTAARS